MFLCRGIQRYHDLFIPPSFLFSRSYFEFISMKCMLRFSTVFLSAILLGSCAVGPDYQRPADKSPNRWVNGVELTQTPINHTWWQCFHDPILTQLVEKAYQQNHDIKIAVEHLRQSRAEVGGAFASLLPQLSVSAEGERARNTVPTFPVTAPYTASQTHFDVSWEIDLFGKNRRRLEAEEALSEAILANLKAVQVSIIAEVARNYIDYRLNEELLRITEENLATQQKTVNLTKKQFSAGQAARFDFLRADSQLRATESQRPKYAGAKAAAQYRLEVLLGAVPGSLTEMLADKKGVPLTSAQLTLQSPVSVIRQRPDVEMVERQLAAATAMEGVAIAQMYPRISLAGFFGILSAGAINTGAGTPERSAFFAGKNRSWYESAAVSMPLFTFGKVQKAIEAAQSEGREAFYQYEQTILKALAEIETALMDFEQEQHRTKSLTQAVDDAKQAVEIAHKRYVQGLTSLLEVLDVERTLFALQEQLAVSQATQAGNLIRLNKAVGGGWHLGILATDNTKQVDNQKKADRV